MKVYTNRYHDFTPSQGIPVRITYGSPRWRLPYTIAASAKTVTLCETFKQKSRMESLHTVTKVFVGVDGFEYRAF